MSFLYLLYSIYIQFNSPRSGKIPTKENLKPKKGKGKSIITRGK